MTAQRLLGISASSAVQRTAEHRQKLVLSGKVPPWVLVLKEANMRIWTNGGHVTRDAEEIALARGISRPKAKRRAGKKSAGRRRPPRSVATVVARKPAATASRKRQRTN